MAGTDILQTLLHLHLANDAVAVVSLPSVLSALSFQSIESSPHLAKWTNRVNALIHSREPGARWAGITLALNTSRLSKSVLINSAQGWIITVLPMLSRNESSVVWKATIRLLAYIFTTTTDLAEFQRHAVTPNIPKFSSALLSLAEKQPDEELKVLCLDTLSIIVPLYPTLHRPLTVGLSTLSLNFLNGSPTPTSSYIVSSASRLHACLHHTGGKVGGATLWRKSMDETIGFCSAAVRALRTTYTSEGYPSVPHADPLVSVPLNLDRLRCGVELLCCLLRTTVSRPVSVPVGSLVNLCVELIKVAERDVLPVDVDPLSRAMEASVTTHILEIGCRLTDCLSKCVQHKLSPHLTRILSIIAYQLEQRTPSSRLLSFVQLLPSLFGPCLPPSDPLIAGRIIKSILPPAAALLSQNTTVEEPATSTDIGGKKGKKRARDYEGDEVFKVGRDVLCESALDGELVLASLDALPRLLRVPNLPTYLQSLSSRLLLSLLIALPTLSASSVSRDPTLKNEILRRVKSTCIEFVSGSSAVLCKSLPMVVNAVTDDDSVYNHTRAGSNHDTLFVDLLLHPRVPPLLRPFHSLDTVALIESTDERATRESLGLCSVRRDVSDSMDVDASCPVVSTSVSGPQHSIHAAVPMTTSTYTRAEDVPPVNLPTASERLAASKVPTSNAIAYTTPVPVHPETLVVTESRLIVEEDQVGSSCVSSTERMEREDVPVAQLVPHPTRTHGEQPQSSRPLELNQMVLDDEDDEGDIEIPVLNMESDTESEPE